MAKEKVLLTGASGSMGGEAFKELLRRRNKYDIVLFLLDSKKERKEFKKWEGEEGVRIVWGDLGDYQDVLKAVKGVDHVLHPAAFIAPAADHNPPKARRANRIGTENIVNAVKEQPNANDITLVSICSLAAYGDRLPPHHMLKVGDPLRPSVGDYYATTKIAAEKAVIESGLRYWASFRQTWIAIPDLLSLMDPIMFHQPPETHIELITKADAGYGLVQSLECPDDFYGRVYNMSGGPSCRVTYSQTLERQWKDLGMGDYTKSLPRNWFALRNFHCGWYEDSHVLNEYLGHWRMTFDDYCQGVKDVLPWYVKYGTLLAPNVILGPIVKLIMRRMADPIKWINGKEEEKIKAFFGTREAWENIGTWDEYVCPPPSTERTFDIYTGDDVQKLAEQRGGQCLATDSGDPSTKLKWKCGLGHEFEASRRLIQAGHWCPECAPPAWNYDEVAKVDPAIGQYYYTNHSKDEHQRVEYLWAPNE
jgi:nucleoside-diphosphate-sugar epimerase